MYTSSVPIRPRILKTEPPPNGVALDFRLLQNYPSPLNAGTLIQYVVPSQARVEIKIYNMLGQVVARVFSGDGSAGSYKVAWTPNNLVSGVYFSEMRAWTPSNTFRKVIKLLYLRWE